MARPVQLVSYNDTTKQFQVNDDALGILRSIEGPVGVISMCGRARQGKSYILNQLLGKNGAFKVASTHRPCTKGLWLWSKPIPRSNGEENFHLVLLDTEGVDAFDQTGQYSTQVFCLAVLLSSLFVFNQMGPIDESSLNQLSLVSEMTKLVRVRAGGGPTRLEDLQEFAPAFVWLLRDFYLELEDSSGELTPREYLEVALGRVDGHGPDIAAKNQLRDSIKALFPNRDCCMLVRPVADESQLVQLDALPQSTLRPEFREGVQNLLRLLTEKTKSKRLGGTIVTGSMLAGFTTAYVQSINDGAVPTIATAWMTVAESETRRALERAQHQYEEAFDMSISADDEAMLAEHQRCLSLAETVFDRGAVGDGSIRDPFREKLRSQLRKRFEMFRTNKRAEAAALMDTLLMQAASDLTRNGPEMTVSQLNQFLQDFTREYENGSVGSIKWEKLCNFIFNNFLPCLIRKATQAEASIQEKLSLEKTLKKLQTELQSTTEERNALLASVDQASIEVQHKDTVIREAKQDATNARLAETSYRQQSQEEISKMQSSLSDIRSERDQMREGWHQEKMVTERRITEGQNQMDCLNFELAASRRQTEELQRQVAVLQTAASPASVHQRYSCNDAASLRTQLNATTNELNEARRTITVLEQELDQSTTKWNSLGRDSALGCDDATEFGIQRPKILNEELEKMTIAQLKKWLTSNDYGDVVFEAQQGAQPRKADWLRMVKERL